MPLGLVVYNDRETEHGAAAIALRDDPAKAHLKDFLPFREPVG